MRRVFLVTDTHFNHRNIIKYQHRPRDYEETIKGNLAMMMNEGDILIHLGDVSLGKDKEVHESFNRMLDFLHSRILVLGNHDGHSNNWHLDRGWTFVCKAFITKHNGKRIIFSHQPMPKIDYCDFNIHGHTHGNQHRDPEHDGFYDEDYHINVSLEEMGYKPILLSSLICKKLGS